MKLEPFWISILMFIGTAIGIGIFYTGMMAAYDPLDAFNTTSVETFYKFNETFSDMEVTTSDLLNRTTSMAKKGISLSLLSDVTFVIIDIVSVIAKTPAMLFSLLTNTYSMIPILAPPWWVQVMITLIIIVMIVVAVIQIFTKSGEI